MSGGGKEEYDYFKCQEVGKKLASESRGRKIWKVLTVTGMAPGDTGTHQLDSEYQFPGYWNSAIVP